MHVLNLNFLSCRTWNPRRTKRQYSQNFDMNRTWGLASSCAANNPPLEHLPPTSSTPRDAVIRLICHGHILCAGYYKRLYLSLIRSTLEVSLSRVDKFAKFDEKLPVRTKWYDGWKSSLISRSTYHLNLIFLAFYIVVCFFLFIISLLIIYYPVVIAFHTHPR